MNRRPNSAMFLFVCAAIALLLLADPAPCAAQLTGPIQNIGVRPELLKDVGIDQKLNSSIPLDLTFRDEAGNAVKLSQFFGQKPVVLSLVYYNCPMLCTQVLNGLDRSLRYVPMDIGKDFNVVTVSIDPTRKADACRRQAAICTRESTGVRAARRAGTS